MPCQNLSTQEHFDYFIRNITLHSASLTFLDLFSLTLHGVDRNFFISVCSTIIIIGICANLCIIVVNILHRMRFSREGDFYTPRDRTRSRLPRESINPFKVSITPENRFRYFNALSSHARFRYSHVTLAVAIFNFLSSVIFIPLVLASFCDWTHNLEAENWILITCVAWTVFQILFMCVFFFVNTTIQFQSLVFPLTFQLRRSPLWGAFVAIVIVCGIQSFLTVSVIFKQLLSMVYHVQMGERDEETEMSIILIQIVLALPIIVYGLTWICTIIMYVIIFKHVHAAIVNVHRGSLVIPDTRVMSYGLSLQQIQWQKVARMNLEKCMVLSAGTSVFYILELPTFLAVYHAVEPGMGVVLAHLTVHAVTPVMHIMLSKSFRAALREIAGGRRRGEHGTIIAFLESHITRT